MISGNCEEGSQKCQVEVRRAKRSPPGNTLTTFYFVIHTSRFAIRTSTFGLRPASFVLPWCVTLRADAYMETDGRIQGNALSGVAGAEARPHCAGLPAGRSRRLFWREGRSRRIWTDRRRRSCASAGRSLACSKEALHRTHPGSAERTAACGPSCAESLAA